MVPSCKLSLSESFSCTGWLVGVLIRHRYGLYCAPLVSCASATRQDCHQADVLASLGQVRACKGATRPKGMRGTSDTTDTEPVKPAWTVVYNGRPTPLDDRAVALRERRRDFLGFVGAAADSMATQ